MEKNFIGERITSLRLNEGISEYKLSKNIGKCNNYINKVASGSITPTLDSLLAICEYFGITPQQFFDMDSPYPSQFATLMEDLKQLDFETLSHLTALVKRLVQNK